MNRETDFSKCFQIFLWWSKIYENYRCNWSPLQRCISSSSNKQYTFSAILFFPELWGNYTIFHLFSITVDLEPWTRQKRNKLLLTQICLQAFGSIMIICNILTPSTPCSKLNRFKICRPQTNYSESNCIHMVIVWLRFDGALLWIVFAFFSSYMHPSFKRMINPP